jgi:ribonuclease BN (tRNA processing enzyme)
VLQLKPLAVGESLTLGARQRPIDVLPASHAVPACGYAVQAPSGRVWVYTGDTGPNPALWEALRGRDVGQLVIEVAFAEADRTVAADSRHHCPSTLAAELGHVAPGVEVLLTHIKPGELETIRAELAERLPALAFEALQAGQTLQLD